VNQNSIHEDEHRETKKIGQRVSAESIMKGGMGLNRMYKGEFIFK
jgi:hypothetical protein